MVWGLSVKSRFLLGAGATLLIGTLGGVPLPAKAADLGGDCCADLEERVAELEATTVRKGNKKVKVELYGRVNRVINFWNDGAESNVYSLNSSYNTSRFGVRGKGKMSDDWSSGFVIEIEDTGNQSRFVNQFNDNTDNGTLRVRKAAISLDSKTYGRVWLGQQEMAKDNINKDTIVIKGLDQTMHQDFYMNWSFFLRQKGFNNAEAFSASTPTFRDIGRCYSTSSSAFDCSTRRNEVRYDTPEWWGFVGSASWGEDDIWSASLRFQKEWDNWKIGAGYAYEDFTDELVNNGGGGVPNQGFKRDMKEWAGTASIIHKPTGLFGSTGGLRIWIELMKRLPTAPLAVPQDGIERAWIAPAFCRPIRPRSAIIRRCRLRCVGAVSADALATAPASGGTMPAGVWDDARQQPWGPEPDRRCRKR